MTSPLRDLERPARTLGTHIPALDGIRGIAIVLVMLGHFTIIAPTSAAERVIVKGLGTGGVTGVELFFVLSGFLITGILYDAKGGPFFFRNFYIRRALRIFPLYYGFLFVLFAVLPRLVSGPLSPEYRLLLQHQGWYWSYLVNVLIAIHGTQAAAPMATHHFWSLAVEEQFYLVWPVVVWASKRETLMVVTAAAVVLALVLRVVLLASGVPHIAVAVLTPTRMDALATGAFLALLARGPDGLGPVVAWARHALVPVGAILLAIFALTGARTGGYLLASIGYTALALFFGAALVIAVTAPPRTLRERAFANPVLRILGRYSYAIYVFHLPLWVAAMRHGLVSPERLPSVAGSQMPAQAVLIVALSTLSLGAGWISWHLYEKHFLQLKELFPYQSFRVASAREEAMRREGDAFAAP